MTDDSRNNSEQQDSHSEILDAALSYLERGFSIVPQRPGEKKPCVRWKAFQDRLPTREEVIDWFTRQFPDAGLAVVLGPISKLFVIDVDGPEAHAELISRLDAEPAAPKVLSGSGKPFRYHLFFRHPAVPTRAKITPWHPMLEFRGNRSIVILPPSLHRSGLRYQWAPGRSLEDIPLPDVPAAVLEALSERAAKDAGHERQADERVLTPAELGRAQKRARAYLAKLAPAIEGQGGDKQTFTVACHLVIDFGLSPAESLPLMREYNERCQPPWSEAELLRKLREADKRPGPRGTMFAPAPHKPASEDRLATSSTASVQTAGRDFVGNVPDFVLTDWVKAQPRWVARDSKGHRRLGRARIGGGFHWAIHLAVITQRSPDIVLPDVLLGQVFWGGDKKAWPSNWRGWLLTRLELFTGGSESAFTAVNLTRSGAENTCPASCVLH
jgi:hypothetical protein